MLLGIVFFFVLAVNRGWIGPVARVSLGAIASALVFGAGLYVKRRYEELYHSALAAVGTGIGGAYMTLLAAKVLYDLVPDWAAMLIAAGIAAVGVATALAWSSELIAGLGLIGAALAPAALGLETGELSAAGTGFAAVVFAGIAVVAVRQRWSRLLGIGVAATAAPGRDPPRAGRAHGMGRRRCRRVLLAALPRRGDGVAGPAGHACARVPSGIPARAERRPRRSCVSGSVRRARRGLGDARGGRRVRVARRPPLPDETASRPERAQRRRRARADRGGPGRPALRAVARSRVGGRGSRAGVARESHRGRQVPGGLLRVPRRRSRSRRLRRRPADAAVRAGPASGRRRRGNRGDRGLSRDRSLVLPGLERGRARARCLRAAGAAVCRAPKEPYRVATDARRDAVVLPPSTPRHSDCSRWPSGCPLARLAPHSSGVTSPSPGSGARLHWRCSRARTESAGQIFGWPVSSGSASSSSRRSSSSARSSTAASAGTPCSPEQARCSPERSSTG